VVFTPCKFLICINIAIFLGWIISYLELPCFLFLWFLEVFLAWFLTSWFEEFFINFFHAFGCWDESHHLPPILEWIYGSSPFDFTDFSKFPQNLSFLVHPKSEGKSLDLGENLFWQLVPCVEVTLMSKFHPIWCSIAQESSLGRKGRILGENHVSRDLLVDNVWLDPDNIRLAFWVSRDIQSDNVQS
jgi:hypothetical protein